MAFSLVANTAKGTADTVSVTTDAIDTTGADLIVINTATFITSDRGVAVTDSKGNTWTPLTQYDGSDSTTRLYYSLNPTVGTGHTFTATSTGTVAVVYPSIQVSAWSGAHDTASYDVENGATGSAKA